MNQKTPTAGSKADKIAPGPRTSRTNLQLGERLKEIRTTTGWTLRKASEKTGLGRSTLSKIENGQMSPTFEVLCKLANGFGIEMTKFFTEPQPLGAAGRRSITRSGQGQPYESPNYEHMILAADLANKKMQPFITIIRAHSLSDYTDWDRHDSEDFMYVFEGSITVHTELYEPVVLNAGDSIYLDGRMGHANVSNGEQDAVALWVTAR